jgi:predicted signal transduction protein with EAL and GGDEF domain
MVHLCSRISDDLDIFWQELVAVLSDGTSVGEGLVSHESDLQGRIEPETGIAAISKRSRELASKATHSLLLREISRGSENDNNGVILQLDVPDGAEID